MKKEKIKVIFVGMPDMAIVCLNDILDNNFDIVGIVPPKKTHETYNFFKEFVLSKNLNFIEFENSPNEKGCIEKIKELNADVGVVCSYNYKLSAEFLKTTKMGYINSHPSKLPDYRGATPYFHIIKNNEQISAITLHFMDENFDTGDIIYQKEFKLFPFETMGTLFNRTNFMISKGLIEVLNAIQDGKKIDRIIQNKENRFLEAPKVDGNFRIRWNCLSSCEIEALIRACNPFFNAFTSFRGVNLKVIKASAIEQNHNDDAGKIIQVNDKEFIVAAKNGYVSLEVFQLGTWGIFSPLDFYYTFSPRIGEVLE